MLRNPLLYHARNHGREGALTMNACIHGEVCRAYLDKFSITEKHWWGTRRNPCILSVTCPNNCKFYEPEKQKGLHFKDRT